MVSRTSLTDAVRAFDVPAVAAGLAGKPELIAARDARGRSWLHQCCAARLAEQPSADASIRLADLFLERGLGLDEAAFMEGAWRATPVWFAIAWGQNLPLADHLLQRGASPEHSLFAAAWNDSRDATRLLLRYGATIEDNSNPHESRCSVQSPGASSGPRRNCCWAAPILTFVIARDAPHSI